MMKAQVCRLLSHRSLLYRFQTRFLSVDPFVNPEKLMEGVTKEDLKKDEELAAFFKANFTKPDDVLEVEENVVQKNDEEIKRDSLNIKKIHCYLRDPVEEEGSRRSEYLREMKKEIPGLLYGSDPTLGISARDDSSNTLVKTPWSTLQRETDLNHNCFESRVYDLVVYEDETEQESTVHRVIPAGVRWHPVKHKLFCANYLRYHAGRPIRIPIQYINEEESPAMKRGGFIAPINRFVSCLVEDGAPIPDFLELECTGLELKEVVRLDRIAFPEGVQISWRVKPDRFVVGTIFGTRSKDGDEDDEDGEETNE